MLKRRSNLILSLICVFIGLVAFSHLGLLFATVNKNTSPFWPAAGFAIFCTIHFGEIALIPILFGAFFANYLIPTPLEASLVIAIGNTLEAFIGHRVFILLYRRRTVLAHLHEVFAIVAGTMTGALSSATLGAIALHLGKTSNLNLVITSWSTWYSGNVVGGMVILSLLLELRRQLRRARKRIGRDIAGAATLIAVFFLLYSVSRSTTVIFCALPLTLFSISYIGRLSAFVLVFGVALVCTFGVWLEIGPFVAGDIGASLLHLTLFLGALSISCSVMISYDRVGVLKGSRRYFYSVWAVVSALSLGFEFISQTADRKHFEFLVARTADLLTDRIDAYSRSLRAGGAMIRASERVLPAEWRVFTNEISLTPSIPGVMGIGYIQPVLSRNLNRFVAEQRAAGNTDFAVHGFTSTDHTARSTEHFVIQFVEPVELNRASLGLDISSDIRRRSAAELARDTGQPAMTAKIQLVQDDKKLPAFLLLTPVYKSQNTITTVADRRKHFSGWVYAPFRTEEFIQNALAEVKNELNIEFFDEGDGVVLWTNKRNLSHHPVLQKTSTLNLAQRNFQVRFEPSAGFHYSQVIFAALASSFGLIVGLLAVGILVNVTISRRRIERLVELRSKEVEQHRASSIEASRLASLGEMAGGIAHEINNPLAIIMAKTESLIDQIEKGVLAAGETEAGLRRIHDVSKRIARIVSGMRKLVRDDSNGSMELYPCDTIIDDALDLCREKFRSQGIKLITSPAQSVQENPIAQIRCRRTQIAQVLVNLLNNAEHAIERLEDRWIRVVSFVEGDWVCIEISDSGGGIPVATANRIMEPFFTTKEVGKGTGLGLAIARNIMQQHGGQIEYQLNRPNTTFVLRFPVVRQNADGLKASA